MIALPIPLPSSAWCVTMFLQDEAKVRSGKLVGAGEQRHIPPIFAKDIHQMVFLLGVNA
jgi:hypothetical protein